MQCGCVALGRRRGGSVTLCSPCHDYYGVEPAKEEEQWKDADMVYVGGW